VAYFVHGRTANKSWYVQGIDVTARHGTSKDTTRREGGKVLVVRETGRLNMLKMPRCS
jgi:hypothetical protein